MIEIEKGVYISARHIEKVTHTEGGYVSVQTGSTFTGLAFNSGSHDERKKVTKELFDRIMKEVRYYERQN